MFAMAFCEKCGAELSEGARFCEQCGAEAIEKKSKPTASYQPRPVSDYMKGGLVTGANLAAIGALVVIVSFFLPWVSVPLIGQAAGYRIPDILRSLSSLGGGSSDIDTVILLIYLVPLLAIASLIFSFAQRNRQTPSSGTPHIIIGIACGLLAILFMSYIREAEGWVRTEIGLYLTLLGSLGMFVGGILSDVERRRA